MPITSGASGAANASAGHSTNWAKLNRNTACTSEAEARTAWAQAGAKSGAYTALAAKRGLATGFGDTGSVGLGGLTLAGGIGYLVRKHGLTIDNVLAAEVVTADGELIRTDAESHPELFWAIRGGGGNFGVATRFLYRLHPVQDIVGGPLGPNGISNCPARLDPPPPPKRPPPPTRERPLSPCVISTVLHSPASIAAAAWRTCSMNEQPPTEVPSTQVGVMPR